MMKYIVSIIITIHSIIFCCLPINAKTFVKTKNDTIHIAFQKIEEKQSVGAVFSLNANEILGYDNVIWASNAFSGRTLGMIGNDNIRGIGIGINTAGITGTGLTTGNALFIVDGLPRDIESLRLSEIEDITVLKDANAAVLYGSAAVNGVVLITTKRGRAFQKQANFSVNYGMSTPLSLPNYLSSADYMTYYNLARRNDGLDPLYDENLIEDYRSGNKYRYPDVDYYSSEYIKSFKPFFDVNGEFSGGNNTTRYYLNLGLHSVGSLLKIGQGGKARYNTFNIRGNVDLKINDWINTAVDAVVLLGVNKGARGNYWGAASTIRPHEYAPLIPIDMINPEDPLLITRKNDIDGKYLLGGNINHTYTPFGDLLSGGSLDIIERKFSFNNRINFLLNNVTEGLSFHTNLSFDYFTLYNQLIDNSYSVYEPTWMAGDQIIRLNQYGVDRRPGTQVIRDTDFQRRIGFYGMLNYQRTIEDDHNFLASLIGYGSLFERNGYFQGEKQTHLGSRLQYSYLDRYFMDFSSALVNSVKLAPKNRLGLSPTMGVSWIMSKEDFIRNVKEVDFLKLQLSGGIINTDLGTGYFYYDDRYSLTDTYRWYEGTISGRGTRSDWKGNLGLGYSKRKNVNVGVDALLFNNLLGIQANIFYDLYSDLVTRPFTNYPGFYSDYIPYENYEKDAYQGVETGISINKELNDWKFSFGATMLYSTSKRLVVDETYKDSYQYRKGYSRDADFGLQAIGFFENQEDIENSPQQSFGVVKPGDIKYKDQNGDGIIDADDEVYLRRWQPPFSGGLQVKISYKKLSLYLLGEGTKGAERYMPRSYYWVSGDDKYSEVVLNSWTPENAATAAYPRLSTFENNNNFRNSDFWLYNDNYFQIRTIQLTYGLPVEFANHFLMQDVKLFFNVSNAFQFAKNKRLRELRVGNEPNYRSFTLGVNIKL